MTLTTPAGVAHNARPYLYGNEETALAQALRSGQYNHSDITDEFEKAIAAYLDVPETVAVASGTAALHFALHAVDVGGGEVIVPSHTFCATVQAVLAAGARPRFIEVDPHTGCVTPAAVLEALTSDTRAVLPVLYGGRAVDLTAARPALNERTIPIVEDAAHAFGSYQGSRRVGASGDLTCFSFGPIKNLTCGLGGMIVPRTPQEAFTLRRLRGLGIVESPAHRANATSYTVQACGMREQMSGLNAAIGLAQLAHFPQAEDARRALWRAYAAALENIDGLALVDVDVERSVPHMCAVRVARDRDRVFHELRQRGIGAGTHYPPNHTQPAFAAWHRPLPVTEKLGQEILTLPFHLHLTADDVDYVARALRQVLAAGAGR